MPSTRSQVTRFTRQLQNATAPVNRLHDEVIALVLKQGLPPNPLKRVSDLLAYLITISSVCRLWRQVALDTVSLWTYISYYTKKKPAADTRSIQRVAIFLQRSKGALIDVTLKVGQGYADNRLKDLASLIRPNLHRCKSFEFLSVTTEPTRHFFPLNGTLPNLRVLDVHLGFLPNPSPPLLLLEENNNCQLHSLVFFGNGVTLSLQNIDSSRINHLMLNGDVPPTSEVIDFLGHCSSLESLTSWLLLGDNARHEKITLPNLTYLTIRDQFPLSFPAILELPRLEHVRVNGHTLTEGFYKYGTVERPSFPSLRTAVIFDSHLRVASIIQFLREHAGLKGLEFTAMFGIPDIIRSLMVPFADDFSDSEDDDDDEDDDEYSTRSAMVDDADNPSSPMLCPSLALLRFDNMFEIPLSHINVAARYLRTLLDERPRLGVEWVPFNHSIPASISALAETFPSRVVVVSRHPPGGEHIQKIAERF